MAYEEKSSDSWEKGGARESNAPGDAQIEEILGRYLDRLNSGEKLDPLEILAAEPVLGPEILKGLRAFVDLEANEGIWGTARSLGDFTIRRQIGRGGMAVVYDAWQNSMDRRVALKVLPPGIAADDRAFGRFMREARTAGKLNHQNIVSVYAMGVDQSTPYFAMEFVEGETLAAILARLRAARGVGEKEAILGSLSPARNGRAPETMEGPQACGEGKATEASAARSPLGRVDIDLRFCIDLAHWFAGAADGLQHAHSRGVIHRDIKPSNLIVERSHDKDGGGFGRLRVLDFGLARLEGQESFTASGDFVGTPLYMSPEQARRRKIAVDHRTDIYSLGATLYEMLTLRPPLQGKDHQDTLSQIVEKDPAPPRKLNPRIPRDLETIVLKCLRKDPWDRYGTAEALAQDLRRFARGDPVEARPQSAWAKVSSRVRRRKRTFLAVVAVPLVLLALVWLAYERKRAEDDAKLARYGPALQRVLEKIYASPFTLEATLGPPQDQARSFEYEGLSPGFFGLRPARTSSHLSPLSPEVFRALRGPADSDLEDAVAELAAIADLLPLEKDAHYHLARAYALLGRPEEAREEIERTLRCDPDFVPARVLRSEMLGDALRLGAHGLGQGGLEEIWSEYEDRRDWRGPWTRAYKALREGDWAPAVEASSQLIALRGMEEEPYVGCFREAYLGRGVAHFKAQDYRLAREDFARADALAGGIEAALLLAKACYLDGDKELARRSLQEAWSRAKGEARRDAALWVSAIYFSLGNLDGALDWAERLGDAPIRDCLKSLLLYVLGSRQEAIAAAREALDRNPGNPLACRLLASALLKDLWSRFGEEPGRDSSHAAEAPAGTVEGEGSVPKLVELIEVVRKCEGMAPESECDWARSLVRAARGAVNFYLRYNSRREAMSARKSLLAAVSVLALNAGEVVKASDACDDWTHGDQNPFDGTPVAWMTWACCPGQWTPAADGNGIDVINMGGPAVAWLLMEQTFSGNVAIRLRASFNGPRTPYPGQDFWWKYSHAPCFGVTLHSNSGSHYVGELYSDGTVDIYKWTGGLAGSPGTPVISSLAFDPTAGDLEIELACTAQDVQMRVWPAGDQRPGLPQVSLADTELRWGYAGVSYADPNDRLPARWYSACLIPLDDETPPEISCPGEVNLEANTGCSHEGLIEGVSASDDRSAPGSITMVYEPETIPLGTSTVAVTATDEAGNSSSCTMTVHVLDATPPEVTCPASLTVECTGAEGAKVDFEAVVADGCDPSPTATFLPASGSTFPPGTTTVTCAASDAAGNTTTCTFEVTVACGGLQLPGDGNGDGKLDISDPVHLLGFLFLGQGTVLPCGDGSLRKPGGSGNVTLLDSNGDGGVDLSDAVFVLGHLFLGGPGPALGKECLPVTGCPGNLRCSP